MEDESRDDTRYEQHEMEDMDSRDRSDEWNNETREAESSFINHDNESRDNVMDTELEKNQQELNIFHQKQLEKMKLLDNLTNGKTKSFLSYTDESKKILDLKFDIRENPKDGREYLTYENVKVTKNIGGRIYFSENKRNEKYISDARKDIDKIISMNKKTFIYQMFDTFGEVKIVEEYVDTNEEKNNIDIEDYPDLPFDIKREVVGILKENVGKILKKLDDNSIEAKRDAYLSNMAYFKNKFESEERSDFRELYRKMSDISERDANKCSEYLNERIPDDTLEKIIEKDPILQDLSRLERLKKWVKENMVGVSILVISVASLITSTMVLTRRALKSGKDGLENVYDYLKKVGKKLGPILGPIVSLLGNIISFGAKGLSFLAENLLCILVLLISYFIADKYIIKNEGAKTNRERRKKT